MGYRKYKNIGNPDFIGSGARQIKVLGYLMSFAGTVRVTRNLAQARVGRTIQKREGESEDPSASHGVRERVPATG